MASSRTWLIPLFFAAVFGVVGWTSYTAIERSILAQIEGQLSTLLDAEIEALNVWIEDQRATARVQAEDPQVRQITEDLVAIELANPEPRERLEASDSRLLLNERLSSVVRLQGYFAFALVSPRGIILTGSSADWTGTRARLDLGLLDRALAEGTRLAGPLPLPRARGEGRQALLVMTPVEGAAGTPVAVLIFGLAAEGEFSRILKVARMGESGETYAVEKSGLMVSASRFEDQLREIGLLEGEEAGVSAMNIHVRDPGGDMTSGHVPELPVLARPLTHMAASVIGGERGLRLEPYPDYRGVQVIGAWTWVPELELGIATEIDAAEAFAGLQTLRLRFGVLVVALLVGAVALLGYSLVVARISRRMEKVQRLGRYELVKKIGEGGMGAVYLARHALLRRPTAMKLLKSDKASKESLQRFEREVQVTAGLTHPNTIAIYDYGHTPEGVFYYAMEYLSGITLGACVEDQGAQPEARVVSIMRQACASLAEAHAAGLIHRDLKPANIMLCERGGQYDVVKVLDFGLVRVQDQTKSMAITSAESLTGTPLYLSPEAVKEPETLDVRSDLYQLGAIAYYVLTGQHVFSGQTVVEVLDHHLNTAPEPPSKVLGHPVSSDLEVIIMRCLEKDRAQRYEDAEHLLQAFDECSFEGRWGRAEARTWWEQWRSRHDALDPDSVDSDSMPSGFALDLLHRTSASRWRSRG